MDRDCPLLEEAAWAGLAAVYGKLLRQFATELQERYHLSREEFEALLLLSWPPIHRLRLWELSARSLLTPSGMSRLVDRLEQAGLVARSACCEDRRGAYVQLTEAGKMRLCAAKATVDAIIHRHFLSLYNEHELATMAAFWQRFLDRERTAVTACEEAEHQARTGLAGPESGTMNERT